MPSTCGPQRQGAVGGRDARGGCCRVQGESVESCCGGINNTGGERGREERKRKHVDIRIVRLLIVNHEISEVPRSRETKCGQPTTLGPLDLGLCPRQDFALDVGMTCLLSLGISSRLEIRINPRSLRRCKCVDYGSPSRCHAGLFVTSPAWACGSEGRHLIREVPRVGPDAANPAAPAAGFAAFRCLGHTWTWALGHSPHASSCICPGQGRPQQSEASGQARWPVQ